MHWVIQQSLYSEKDFEMLARTLDRFGVSYDVISIDDVTGRPIPEVCPTGSVMAWGTHRLAQIAVERGWRPGTFLNDNHHHRAWVSAWGDRMLNAAAVTRRFRDVIAKSGPMFIRPTHDNKFFDGQILDAQQIAAWRDAILRGEPSPVRCSDRFGPDTEIVYGPAIQVYRESRFFVVDGSLVAWSTYRLGKNVVADPEVDPIAIEFSREAVAVWQPARGFALDVALTSDGYKIVEVDCLNMSSFYGADVQRLVAALENMDFDNDAHEVTDNSSSRI